MLSFALPDGEAFDLEHLCLDLNGTLAVDGRLLPGVAELLREVSARLTPHLLTAGTHGGIPEVEHALGLSVVGIGRGEEKVAYVARLGKEKVVAMGNGRNDVAMLRSARLGIAVLGGEGVARDALLAADIVVASPLDGLSLLLHPDRLRATLRR